MNIQLLSDLHLEFMKPEERTNFIKSLDPTNVDVLVLAGDIVTLHSAYSLREFAQHYEDSHIVYVNGNHEFYGCWRPYLIDLIRDIEEAHPNFHFLDHDSVEINGQRFLGTPLWYFPTKQCMELLPYWGEFEAIPQWHSWVFKENKAAIDFLVDNMTSEDIVVTHYLPCEESISRKWKKSTSNAFFYCQMDHWIQEKKPKLWLHGHTHDSCDYKYHDTRIVCNPRGYEGHEVNKDWNSKLIINI